MNDTNKIKRGRKARVLKFPTDKPFTVKSILGRLRSARKPMTAVGVTLNLNRLVKSGVLAKVGKVVSKRKGRPAFLYEAVKQG